MAVTIYIASRLQLPLPNWIYYYINDFLCMPIVLGACLAVLRLLKQTEALYVPLPVIVVLTVYFIIHFEWIMPEVLTRYTSDPVDIALYILGAFLFWVFQKKLF